MRSPDEYQTLVESATVYGCYELTYQIQADYTEVYTRLAEVEQELDLLRREQAAWRKFTDEANATVDKAEKERDELLGWTKGVEDRLCEATLSLAEMVRVETERDELRAELQQRKDNFYRNALYWRGIDEEYGGAKVCNACGGSGQRGYGSTSTWHGGVGGQQITGDVCDKCWGSGDLNNKGADLRRLTSELQGAKRELAAAQQSAKEQFGLGLERAAEIVKSLDTDGDAESYNCGYVFARSAIECIREAAKEGK